ncbi:MAG: glucose-1-phosphate cytidylyltransferase [Acidimicrobiia bacterium]|nr:glucose-1-phosphate cytidylyltransferase [Acidimicrobiia bacterium]
MKVVLLAGGLGTRLREETEYRPKPMVEVGGRPILWHIMKNFAHFGLNEFVVCTGYKGEVIKEYFLHYEARMNDFTIHLGPQSFIEYRDDHEEANWIVTVADTGATTMTGGRVKRIERHVDGPFIVTYGDGLADVDIDALLEFHRSHGRLATVTTVRPLSRFGVMDIGPDGVVEQFREKPQGDGNVNAGFFVFEPQVFDYLTPDCVLEEEPLERLAADKQLVAYRHDGFWQPMDTYRESTMLNEMWDRGDAPWKVW